MGAFADLTAAEDRIKSMIADAAWINAYSCRLFDGTIAIRAQRYMSPTNPDYGKWVEITDDSEA